MSPMRKPAPAPAFADEDDERAGGAFDDADDEDAYGVATQDAADEDEVIEPVRSQKPNAVQPAKKAKFVTVKSDSDAEDDEDEDDPWTMQKALAAKDKRVAQKAGGASPAIKPTSNPIKGHVPRKSMG